MKLTDASSLEQILATLDGYLLDGYNRSQSLLSDYKKESTEEGFNAEDYYNKKLANINEWFPKVHQFLNESFQLKYHLFHFVNPKTPAGIMKVGLPDNLSNLSIRMEYYLYALEDIILRLEEQRNLAIRQEIAERESQADILYKITYSDHTREVKLNNIVLTKTDFDSENDNCFNYIYSNPGRPVGIQELEQAVGIKIKKRLVHIVRDLGFVNELKTIFFPVVTKNQIMFINPITKQYAYEKNLPPINFKKIGRQSKVE